MRLIAISSRPRLSMAAWRARAWTALVRPRAHTLACSPVRQCPPPRVRGGPLVREREVWDAFANALTVDAKMAKMHPRRFDDSPNCLMKCRFARPKCPTSSTFLLDAARNRQM